MTTRDSDCGGTADISKATHVVEGLDLSEKDGTSYWMVHLTPLNGNDTVILYFDKREDLKNFCMGQAVRLDFQENKKVKEKV